MAFLSIEHFNLNHFCSNLILKFLAFSFLPKQSSLLFQQFTVDQ